MRIQQSRSSRIPNHWFDLAKKRIKKCFNKMMDKIIVPLIVTVLGGLLVYIKIIILNPPKDNFGVLHVLCNVESASISLNDIFKGFTLSNNIVEIDSITQGTHKLTIKKNGYDPVTIDNLKITAEETTTARVELAHSLIPPPLGILHVLCNVDSARVYLNGIFKGFTSSNGILEVDSISPGAYILSVYKNGCDSVTIDNVNIEANKVTTQRVELTCPTSEKILILQISNQVDNARIYVDGELRGSSPVCTVSLTEGAHAIVANYVDKLNQVYEYSDTVYVDRDTTRIFVLRSDFRRRQ